MADEAKENVVRVPSIGEKELPQSAVTDAEISLVLSGLLIPNQALGKALARKVASLQAENRAMLDAATRCCDAAQIHAVASAALQARGIRNNEPPRHPFEVRITIGGNDWDYVRRAILDISDHLHAREPQNCGLASGGSGGSHSIDVFRRDVTVEQFHAELEEWRQGQVAARKEQENDGAAS